MVDHVEDERLKRRRVRTTFEGPSLTRQSMAESCDINVIMGRYLRSGNIDHLARHGGEYGFASSQTFHEAMNIVRKAEEMFSDLPALTRKRFGNDPAAFLDFVQDVNEDGELRNLDEMRKLGLAVPEAAPVAEVEPQRVVIVEDDRTAYGDDGEVPAPVRAAPAPKASPRAPGAAKPRGTVPT